MVNVLSLRRTPMFFLCGDSEGMKKRIVIKRHNIVYTKSLSISPQLMVLLLAYIVVQTELNMMLDSFMAIHHDRGTSYGASLDIITSQG